MPSPSTRAGSTRSSTASPRTPASRPARWPASPPAASCRGSPSRSSACWPRPTPRPTLVFDEVDTGVGGRSADPDRPQPVGPRPAPPGPVRHASAADRGARRRPLPHRQARARRPDRHRGRAAGPRGPHRRAGRDARRRARRRLDAGRGPRAARPGRGMARRAGRCPVAAAEPLPGRPAPGHRRLPGLPARRARPGAGHDPRLPVGPRRTSGRRPDEPGWDALGRCAGRVPGRPDARPADAGPVAAAWPRPACAAGPRRSRASTGSPTARGSSSVDVAALSTCHARAGACPTR